MTTSEEFMSIEGNSKNVNKEYVEFSMGCNGSKSSAVPSTEAKDTVPETLTFKPENIIVGRLGEASVGSSHFAGMESFVVVDQENDFDILCQIEYDITHRFSEANKNGEWPHSLSVGIPDEVKGEYCEELGLSTSINQRDAEYFNPHVVSYSLSAPDQFADGSEKTGIMIGDEDGYLISYAHVEDYDAEQGTILYNNL